MAHKFLGTKVLFKDTVPWDYFWLIVRKLLFLECHLEIRVVSVFARVNMTWRISDPSIMIPWDYIVSMLLSGSFTNISGDNLPLPENRIDAINSVHFTSLLSNANSTLLNVNRYLKLWLLHTKFVRDVATRNFKFILNIYTLLKEICWRFRTI